MSQEYRVEEYQLGDEAQIVPLIVKAYKVWPFFDIVCSPIEHWRWKYLETPDSKNMLLNVKHGNRIVAAGHNIICKVLIKGEQYEGAYGTDACVDPDYQGRGIYRLMTKAFIDLELEENIHFIYMVTVNPKVINSKNQRVATPYGFPYNIQYLNRIEDIKLHAETHGLGYRWRIGQLFKGRSAPIRAPDLEKNIVTVKEFDQTFSPFLEKIHDYYDFIRVRTIENLNWRYLDPRGGDYQVRAIMKDGYVEGYAVYRINRQKKYHEGYIVDLLASPEHPDYAEALLLDGLNYFKENKINSIIYQVVENHPYEKLASKYGFLGDEANRRFFYNNWGYEGRRLDEISPERFHLAFGDLTGI